MGISEGFAMRGTSRLLFTHATLQETHHDPLQTLPGPLSLPRLALMALALGAAPVAFAHGDVTPQAVDTKELPQLGKDLKPENRYRGHAGAIKVGSSA
jgi:cytochrome c-550 PedF